MRYIDADKIIYTWLIDADGKEHDGVTLQSVIDAQPTADVRENIHAKKVIGGGEHDGATCWIECSSCHGAVDAKDTYCKHCGAKFVLLFTEEDATT